MVKNSATATVTITVDNTATPAVILVSGQSIPVEAVNLPHAYSAVLFGMAILVPFVCVAQSPKAPHVANVTLLNDYSHL